MKRATQGPYKKVVQPICD